MARLVLEVARLPASSGRCRSLAFVASRRPFIVTDGGFTRVSSERRTGTLPLRIDRLHTFTSPPTRPVPGRIRTRILPPRSSLPGSPPPTYPRVSTPRPRLRDRSVPWGHHGISFRPRGFAPPRRLPPPRELRACCSPVPDLGFAGFRHGSSVGSRKSPGSTTRSPPAHTLRRLSLAGSRTPSLGPFPSCRSSPCPRIESSGPGSLRSPIAARFPARRRVKSAIAAWTSRLPDRRRSSASEASRVATATAFPPPLRPRATRIASTSRWTGPRDLRRARERTTDLPVFAASSATEAVRMGHAPAARPDPEIRRRTTPSPSRAMVSVVGQLQPIAPATFRTPLSLAVCGAHEARRRPAPGSCSTDESVACPDVAIRTRSFLPWVLVPFEAPVAPWAVRSRGRPIPQPVAAIGSEDPIHARPRLSDVRVRPSTR
jgi:hypothetical protein